MPPITEATGGGYKYNVDMGANEKECIGQGKLLFKSHRLITLFTGSEL